MISIVMINNIMRLFAIMKSGTHHHISGAWQEDERSLSWVCHVTALASQPGAERWERQPQAGDEYQGAEQGERDRWKEDDGDRRQHPCDDLEVHFHARN